ncbi:Diphthamide biosynthesis protein 1 [Blyttiomyces sp. JEL0837]|nr:Diphthamide biosynthesis protein 1 [Blyttiomyces sp. JEL0837]
MSSRAEQARKKFVGVARSKANNADKQDEVPGSNVDSIEESTSIVPAAKPQSKIVAVSNQIPDEILNNERLNLAIKQLPSNYKFEIHKTVHQVQQSQAKKVALQFPEGLLMYSLTIADILENFTGVETVVMGDVTYGACCVDDYTATALGCDFMVHYGHSCLVPVNITTIKMLYVFVEIGIDTDHFVRTIRKNFEVGSKLVFVATIQFISSLQSAKKDLENDYAIMIPQSRPLSPGEILGCTAPRIEFKASTPNIAATNNTLISESDPIVVYLGDGRFHLEAIMIANPHLAAFRYDPYARQFTSEKYDHGAMRRLRSAAINSMKGAKRVGLVVGTLGRQGSPKVVDHLKSIIRGPGTELELVKSGERQKAEVITILLSELFPYKLKVLGESGIDAWVQTSCPRLSIDWGHSFDKPVLSPYEAAVAVGKAKASWIDSSEREDYYPMDFYAKQSLGPWTPNYTEPKPTKVK